MKIRRVNPQLALPGGMVRIELEGEVDPGNVQVRIGEIEAHIVAASPSYLTVRVDGGNSDELRVESDGEVATGRLKVGAIVADELHPVTSPVVDRLGNVYVTYSGARGENVPFCVFIIHPDGSKHAFLADIINPTGLVIGPDEFLYISSRHTGTVYRSSFDKQVEKFVEGLGLATGLAFDSHGNLFVGDRGGNVYRVSPDGEASVFCELEPSISAYHMTIDAADYLYLTGPTLATQDQVYRISPEGQVESYFRRLGRPQGLAIDPEGNLQVAASYQGRKGIFGIVNGEAVMTLAGPMLVGVAYSPVGDDVYFVDHQRLYSLSLD